MGSMKRYTREFQLRAARLVIEQGYTQREVAERLGTTSWSVGHWIKKYQASGELGKAEDVQPAADDLKALRSEIERLKMENEILKKAAAYFAKESVQGTPGFETTPRSTRSK